MLINFMHVLKDLRNRVAHDNTLLYFESHYYPKYQKFLHDKRKIEARGIGKRTKYFHSFLCVQMFISKNNYQSIEKEISKLVSLLDDELKTISADKILDTLGLKENWRFEF